MSANDRIDGERPLAADDTGAAAMIGAVSRTRFTVMQRASTLLEPRAGIPFVEQVDALPNVTSLLMTTIEELKIAEEELRRQNDLLTNQRSEVDERLRHYHALFLHGPLPAVVTDRRGTIVEANAAAAALLRRDRDYLAGKPFAVLVPLEQRESFRLQLLRLTEDGVVDWRIAVQPHGDVPAVVSAAVSTVPDVARTGGGSLLWVLRVIDGGSTPK